MAIRRLMMMGLTNYIRSLIYSYKERVLGNQGQFEGETCLNNTLENMGIDLFEKASLVITPNGYKENVLYSVTPSPIGTNLFQYSQWFENNYWYKFNGVLTNNDSTAPNGRLEADLFTKTSAVNTTTNVSRTNTSPYLNTGIHTFSIYAKPKVGETMAVRMDRDATTAIFTFNFTTKTFINSGINVVSSTYEELADGWFRIICTANATSLWKIDACLLFSNPTGDAMWIWGAQLEEGTTASVYIPTYLDSAINQTICDFQFSRSTLATRVNVDGLIEMVPYNILTMSTRFELSNWIKNLITISSTYSTAPNSLLEARTVQTGVDASANRHRLIQQFTSTVIGGNTYTFSIYAKKNQHSWIQVNFTANFSVNDWANFDLENGVIGNTGTGAIASIEDVGDGWYRLWITGTAITTGAATNSEILVINNTNSGRYPSYQSLVAEDVFDIWGAQLVDGTQPREYYPTTDRLDIPRIDYTDRECPVILSEPQMTNSWTNNNNSTGYATITNAVKGDIVPNAFGYGFNGFEYNFIGGGTFLSSTYTIRTIDALGSTIFRICLYIKNPSSDFFGINHSGGAGQCFYQFSTLTARNYFTPATENGKIVKINDDTYALYLWSDATSGGQYSQVRVGFVTALTNQNTIDGTAIVGLGYYQGSTSTVGMQDHSYTPIITTTAAVTRNADYLYHTFGYDLIGQTEGTIFLDFDKTLVRGGIKTLLSMNTLINDETLYIQTANNNTSLFIAIVSTSNGVLVQRAIPTIDGKNKLVVVYSTSVTKIFINGEQLVPLTNTALPVMYNINLGNRQGSRNYGNVRQFVLWKTQITDEQAINLTTL